MTKESSSFFVLLQIIKSFLKDDPGLMPEVAQELWPDVIQTAVRQRVMPVLNKSIKASADIELPTEAKESLDRLYIFNVAKNVKMFKALQRILKASEARSLDIFPFKGHILSHYLYGDISFRQISDLDVYCRIDHLNSLLGIFNELGYILDNSLIEKNRAAALKFRSSAEMFHKQSKLLLEPHWRIFDGYFPELMDNADVFEQALEYEFEGQRTRHLDNFSLLMLLCVHPARHNWDNLGSVVDLAQFIRLHEKSEWCDWLTRAKSVGGSQLLLGGLEIAAQYFDIHMPIEAEIIKNTSRQKVVERFTKTLASKGGNNSQTISRLQSFSLNLLMRERMRERLHYLKYMISPKRPELNFITLPKFLHFFYYVLRWMRLVKIFKK